MDQRNVRGQVTRDRIVSTSLKLFAELGYTVVSIETVLQACGISRGALYHHFASKDAIFEAVLEEAERRVIAIVLQAGQGASNPLDALRAGCRAWLELAGSDAALRRIVLVDAPAVLGWEKWRAVDDRYALGLIRQCLVMVASEGRMESQMVEVYAHSILAVLTELALLVARSPSVEAMRRAQDAVEQVLSRFVGVEPFSRGSVS